MGCCFFSSDEPKIKIVDCTPPGDEFNCLRPQGTIMLSIDIKYSIPLIDITILPEMTGMKIVFVFGSSILNRESIFCCLKELLCRHLVLVRCCLTTMVLILHKNDTKKSTNSPARETSYCCSINFGLDTESQFSDWQIFYFE